MSAPSATTDEKKQDMGEMLTKTASAKSDSFGSRNALPELESDLSRFERDLPDSLKGRSLDELRAMERKLVRTIDLRIMPVTIIAFVWNIIDRNGLTNAKLGGLEADLGLSHVQYQTALMILYVGYLLMQLPSNMLLPYTRPSIYIPTAMFLWGIASGCSAAVQNFAGLVVCRFWVGFIEAVFLPAVVFLMSCFYTKRELPTRIALLYLGNSASNMLGGLFAAGILANLDGAGGVQGWRWLFIIEAICTVLVALSAYYLLPDWPSNTRWLSQEQRDMAVHRITADAAGAKDEDLDKWYQGAALAVKDPLVWLCVLMQHGLSVTNSYSQFFPSIVKTLGYDRIRTLALTAPPYAFAFIVSVFTAWHSGKTNERCFHIIIPMCVTIIGTILMMFLKSLAGRYVSMFMVGIGSYAAFSLILSWISATMVRPKAKRAAALAISNALANISHVYTSYAFSDSTKPYYRPGGSMICGFAALVCVCALSLRTLLKKRNDKMERDETERVVTNDGLDANGQLVNPMGHGFRYTL
ncbi:uncharacterized protein PFL1_02195 [Pseudozyma flocculosa PF-1]|uniref:Related to nicotinamide mononucleotide permease n=1 Tax=Pseudozyma flocculosa TaxID=84751 RepID=A0A5C3FAJ7_9BASI|nr:uncharacterized protein PFL1_02195 [Pseudozyma flocculosa PF-1]EPQ30078.1 hypothetical protein PFL1_02195 [Pseudozyma flocculosa PF-1]SPO41422.1 related to nicotinamide mononucleotide permease [Pseudozyma flocculosa]